MNEFIVTPVAGAVIGYFTNWLAIKMMFRPHEAKYVFGLKLPFTPGLIPKERFKIAKRLGQAVAENIITSDMIRAKILSDENMEAMGYGLQRVLHETKEPVTRIILSGLEDLRKELAQSEQGVMGYLPAETMDFVEKAAYAGIPHFTRLVNGLPPEVSEKLKELIGRMIEEAVGKIAAAFIKRDRVYDSIRKAMCEYLDDESNRAETAHSIRQWLTRLLEDKSWLEQVPSDTAEEVARRIIDMVFDKATIELFRSEAVKTGISHAITAALANMDLGDMAETQINSMDASAAEDIIISVVNRELRAIAATGGVLGFIIGLLPGILRLFFG